MGRNDRTAAGGSERPASKRSHISLGIGLGPMAAPSAFLRAQQASVSSYRIKVMGTCGAAAAGITLACRAKLWHNFRVIVVTSLHGSAVASFSLLCREKMALLLLLQVPIPPSCYYVPTLPQMQNVIFSPKDVLVPTRQNAPPFWRVMMMKGPGTHFSAIHGIFSARASNL